MRDKINQEFYDKMRESNRLKKEAFQTLIPEYISKHLDVIQSEFKAMLVAFLLEAGMAQNGKKSDRAEKSAKSSGKVNKVDIG